MTIKTRVTYQQMANMCKSR